MYNKGNSDILCTCGGKCEGVCRSQNLHRKRKFGDICPAAVFTSSTYKPVNRISIEEKTPKRIKARMRHMKEESIK